MIMNWNQKEVFMGYSLLKFNEVRDILVANRIKYKHRVISNNRGSMRGRTGTFG